MSISFHRACRSITSFAILSLLLAPQFAAAGTASVLTRQVVPPNGNSCAPLFVSEVTPYIYDGELHSFDVVVSDSSYVGISGMAGSVSVPFNYITRRIEPDGRLRIHIDTTVAIGNKLPVSLTLLSALNGTATCLSTIAFTTDRVGSVESGDASTGALEGSSISSGSPGVSVGSTHSGIIRQKPSKLTTPAKRDPLQLEATTTATSSRITAMILNMCTGNGVYQFWFVLLAIFFVIISLASLSYPPIIDRNHSLPALLIGTPLLILLGFWLLVAGCRMSVLIPIILVLAAAVGLYTAYRTSPIMRPVLTLPPAQKKGPDTLPNTKK